MTLSFAMTSLAISAHESVATYNRGDDAPEAVDEGEEYGQVA